MQNRWLCAALPAVLIHISIGSVYAWSVLTKPIASTLGLSTSEVTWAFSIAIFFLGISAAFLGSWVEKIGPKKSAIICAVFFGTGLIGSGFAIQLKSLPLLFFFYGVVGGIGLGTGYITPIKTLIRWFYDRKGLATGIAVMGFGFSAKIAGPLMEMLISNFGLSTMFFIIGTAYTTLILTASCLISSPPDGYDKPEQSASGTVLEQYTVGEAFRKLSFWALWIMLFVNISCGISLISVASPMLQEKFPLVVTAAIAAGIVGTFGLANGFGRLGWASFSDFLGRPAVFSGFLLLQTVLFLLLSFEKSSFMFSVWLCVIGTCYGGGFACIPAYLGDMYGTKSVSAIHGRILSAWALAGIVGPFIITRAKDYTGNYDAGLQVLAGAMFFALIVSVYPWIKYRQRMRLT